MQVCVFGIDDDADQVIESWGWWDAVIRPAPFSEKDSRSVQTGEPIPIWTLLELRRFLAGIQSLSLRISALPPWVVNKNYVAALRVGGAMRRSQGPGLVSTGRPTTGQKDISLT